MQTNTPVAVLDRPINSIEITPETVALTLREAVGEIEYRGWCQGEEKDVNGKVCALGAIDEALLGRYGISLSMLQKDGTRQPKMLMSPEVQNLREVVVDNLASALPYHSDDLNLVVAAYNDDQGRTENDIKKVMLSVADSVETR